MEFRAWKSTYSAYIIMTWLVTELHTQFQLHSISLGSALFFHSSYSFSFFFLLPLLLLLTCYYYYLIFFCSINIFAMCDNDDVLLLSSTLSSSGISIVVRDPQQLSGCPLIYVTLKARGALLVEIFQMH